MGRRAPGAVRGVLPRRGQGEKTLNAIDGLSTGALREIRFYERSRLWPGAVARALTEWKRAVHRPISSLLQDTVNAGCPCCDPLEHRDVLAQALAGLGPKARREIQAQVKPLDELFQRRTHHDPLTAAELPWWRRRT